MIVQRIPRAMRGMMAVTLTFLLWGLAAHAQPSPDRSHAYRLSGPYTHKNLTIYLVHGDDRLKGRKFLTLQEALEKKLVVVYETGSVNQLEIENRSKDRDVFVQAGDIVRGGRQDRVLSFDLILPPKSGRVPISSFCVEQGRWSKRSGESSTEFNSSNNQLAGRGLKLAAKYRNEQREVWDKVAETQKKLGDRLGAAVVDSTSTTSMELALNNEKVRENVDEYVKALREIIKGKKDVIGFVFAINGAVNSADVYGSNDLFVKLWPKLLNAASVEAIAEHDETKPTAAPKEEAVREAFNDAASGKAQQNDVNKRVRVVIQETKQNVMFETRDREADDAWIHRNYIKLE